MHVSYLMWLLLIMLMITPGIGAVSSQEQIWTNENTDKFFNTPDKPTLVTFNSCVKILSITTNHWNYGKGDNPGKISLFHEDGTQYGPWGTFGKNGTKNELNVYWVSNPGDELKPGTYSVADSNPTTWAYNDGSDNRGIVTVAFEPAACLNESGNVSLESQETITPIPTIPEEMEGGVTITTGDLDPATLKGGANNTETVPVIEQVAFRPISSSIHGGDPAYVMLRVKNTGGRALEDGYVTIRFISKDGKFSYKGGTAHLPTIYPGEERDVPLIIKTQGAGEKKTGNTLYCSEYLLDGSINELMEGGYFEKRGELSMPREKFIDISGCCQEPYSGTSVRGCRGE